MTVLKVVFQGWKTIWPHGLSPIHCDKVTRKCCYFCRICTC